MVSENGSSTDWLEALDRAVQEVEALQAIYPHEDNQDESASTIRLLVKSTDEIDRARELVEAGEVLGEEPILTLELEMLVAVEEELSESSSSAVRLYFGLPPGYPSHEACRVTVLTAEGLDRTAREELSRHLQAKSRDWKGAEAIMLLAQECQEQLAVQLQTLRIKATKDTPAKDADDLHSSSALGRRWLWVHHITDRQRKEDIVREAHDRALGGYLKAGYPGIVVVEGPQRACDEFVAWIKGNKSRPGGFGRQWGHHVRGELEIAQRQLPDTFVALEEDMSVLASQCRQQGLEDEFLKFVLQH